MSETENKIISPEQEKKVSKGKQSSAQVEEKKQYIEDHKLLASKLSIKDKDLQRSLQICLANKLEEATKRSDVVEFIKNLLEGLKGKFTKNEYIEITQITDAIRNLKCQEDKGNNQKSKGPVLNNSKPANKIDTNLKEADQDEEDVAAVIEAQPAPKVQFNEDDFM